MFFQLPEGNPSVRQTTGYTRYFDHQSFIPPKITKSWNTINPWRYSMDYTDIYVNAPIQNVQQMVQQVFHQNGFKIDWKGQYAGKAKKGSKGANVALGALASYYEIDFKIFAMKDQSVAVRLVKATSGLLFGGVVGAMKVKKQYKAVVDMLSNYFRSQGSLKGRNPP